MPNDDEFLRDLNRRGMTRWWIFIGILVGLIVAAVLLVVLLA